MEVKEPGKESKTKWSSVVKIAEKDKYFFIYVTSESACIIPKFKIKPDKSEEIIQFIRTKSANLQQYSSLLISNHKIRIEIIHFSDSLKQELSATIVY